MAPTEVVAVINLQPMRKKHHRRQQQNRRAAAPLTEMNRQTKAQQ